MAGSRKSKQIKQRKIPGETSIVQKGNPSQYYSQPPAWTFANSDQEMWAFSKEHIGELIWTEILPRLKALETQSWSEILVKNKKQNLHKDIIEKIVTYIR